MTVTAESQAAIRFYTLPEAAEILRSKVSWLEKPENARRCGGAKHASGQWLFTDESMRAAFEAVRADQQPPGAPPRPAGLVSRPRPRT